MVGVLWLRVSGGVVFGVVGGVVCFFGVGSDIFSGWGRPFFLVGSANFFWWGRPTFIGGGGGPFLGWGGGCL